MISAHFAKYPMGKKNGHPPASTMVNGCTHVAILPKKIFFASLVSTTYPLSVRLPIQEKKLYNLVGLSASKNVGISIMADQRIEVTQNCSSRGVQIRVSLLGLLIPRLSKGRARRFIVVSCPGIYFYVVPKCLIGFSSTLVHTGGWYLHVNAPK